MGALQGYLDHKKQRPPMTLQREYAQGPLAALTGVVVSYERSTPVVTAVLSLFAWSLRQEVTLIPLLLNSTEVPRQL